MTAIWRALVFAVLLAFSWQSFVTQTHLHLETAAGAGSPLAGVLATKPLSASSKTPFGKPASCPICRDAAQTAHYLPPIAPVLDPPAAITVRPDVPSLISWHVLARSHAWRGRGPPAPLHA